MKVKQEIDGEEESCILALRAAVAAFESRQLSREESYHVRVNRSPVETTRKVGIHKPTGPACISSSQCKDDDKENNNAGTGGDKETSLGSRQLNPDDVTAEPCRKSTPYRYDDNLPNSKACFNRTETSVSQRTLTLETKLTCSHPVTKGSNLSSHLRRKQNSSAYECDEGDENFPAEQRLVQHNTENERHDIDLGSKPHKYCVVSGEAATSKSKLQVQQKLNCKPCKCDQYDNNTTTRSRHLPTKDSNNHIEEQLSVNDNKNHYQCLDCGKNFSSKHGFARHVQAHLGLKPFKCGICDKCFVDASDLNRHRQTHSGLKPYKCDLCGRSYSRINILKQHTNVHLDLNPFQCDVCEKGFWSRSSLARHKEKYLGLKLYECDLCHKSMSSKFALKRHHQRHSGLKPYKCDECHKCFTAKSSLADHKKTHSGLKPYKCGLCEKSFLRSQRLNVHQANHSAVRAYSCDECSKKFATERCLIQHKKGHLGLRPYQCDQCKKGFTSNCSLSRHRKIHLFPRPYQCDKCEKGFTTSFSLARHKKTHADAIMITS